jgi:hypothetical protein
MKEISEKNLRPDVYILVEMMKDGFMKIEKVAGDDNPADGLTKRICDSNDALRRLFSERVYDPLIEID